MNFVTAFKILNMKSKLLEAILILLFLPCIIVSGRSRLDSLKYKIAVSYLIDLSDTYGGGEIFNGEFDVSKSWYGAKISYGHFISQSDFVFNIPLEETGIVLEIPFEEMAIMKLCTFSLTITPIQVKWFSTEILFGGAFGKAERSCFKGVEYSYSTTQNKLTSLSRDYQMVRKTHIGYQIGLSLSISPLKKVGFQLNVRLQDLSNGGTFFFIGGGVYFKL